MVVLLVFAGLVALCFVLMFAVGAVIGLVTEVVRVFRLLAGGARIESVQRT